MAGMGMRVSAIALALTLAGCGGAIVPNGPSSVPAPRTTSVPAPTPDKPAIVVAKPVDPAPVTGKAGEIARSLGVRLGPDMASFGLPDLAYTRALSAFKISCPVLVKRKDATGLTRGEDWAGACQRANTITASDARSFFENEFDVVQIGDGKGFATGYYEPEIVGSRSRSDRYSVPVYKRPPELKELDLGEFSETLKGKKIRGKVVGDTFVPFSDRTEIEEGALANRGLEIAWVEDPVEFFFLQVQGSGRLRLPDGGIMRIGYDSQNGRDYTGIGKLMKERGLLGPGQSSMQGIMGYLRANPEEGKKIMRENRSWVFFRELTGPGPLGALNKPLTAKGSVAADPNFVPLGAPVILSMDRAEASGLWIAQDTGGAIKGSNRFDTFWGFGDEARTIAGGMSARGSAFILLPKGLAAQFPPLGEQ